MSNKGEITMVWYEEASAISQEVNDAFDVTRNKRVIGPSLSLIRLLKCRDTLDNAKMPTADGYTNRYKETHVISGDNNG